jgi:hypothetical protein
VFADDTSILERTLEQLRKSIGITESTETDFDLAMLLTIGEVNEYDVTTQRAGHARCPYLFPSRRGDMYVTPHGEERGARRTCPAIMTLKLLFNIDFQTILLLMFKSTLLTGNAHRASVLIQQIHGLHPRDLLPHRRRAILVVKVKCPTIGEEPTAQ